VPIFPEPTNHYSIHQLFQLSMRWFFAADDIHQTKEESQTHEGARCLDYKTQRFKAGPHDAGAKDSTIAQDFPYASQNSERDGETQTNAQTIRQ
jgi:hypothetical protein